MRRPALSTPTVLVALVVALTIFVHGSTLAYYVYRSNTVDASSPFPIADQIGAISALLERAHGRKEEQVLRALNSPYLVVRKLPPGERVGSLGRNPLERWMQSTVDQTVKRDTAASTEAGFEFVDRRRVAPQLERSALPFDEKVMRVRLVMADGRQFAVVSGSPFLSLGFLSRQFGNTLLLALILAVVTLFLVRRFIAPLGRFAEAADRLSDNIDAPALDVDRGLSEVRSAARSFNLMQSQIKALIEERTQMLAAISHDMRTIVTRWGLRAEAMEDPVSRARSLADVAELNGMIAQFLDFARASSQAMEPRAIDLASLLLSLCDECREDGSNVECSVPDRLVAEVDRIAIKRIVQNLVSNAVRHGGMAQVSACLRDGMIELAICDRGPGIPEDQLERLLEPYRRLDESRSRDTGGIGLGLTIVRTLAARIGAEFRLANRQGGGLEATLKLSPKSPHRDNGATESSAKQRLV